MIAPATFSGVNLDRRRCAGWPLTRAAVGAAVGSTARSAAVAPLLAVLLAGCGTAASPRLGPTPSAVTNGGAPAADNLPAARPTASGGTAGRTEAGTTGPTTRASPDAPPVGWALTDIPSFPPAPPPKPVSLPADGSAPYLSRIETDQPVAFITIDDGGNKHPEAPKLLAAAKVPVTLFLTTDMVRDDVGYFAELQRRGAVIEAHSISHPQLQGRPYDFQKRQVCGSADELGQWYGRRPKLFRPPFGDKDATTMRAVRDCDLRAAFFWKETVDKGRVRFQEGDRVQRGDIILMHFRPAFPDDFIAALRAIHQAGLTPALLEDYIPGAR